MNIFSSILFNEVDVGRHHDINTSADRMSKVADKVTAVNPKILQYVELRLKAYQEYMKNKKKDGK